MGKHLDRARSVFGSDTRGMLDGGRHALLHTRTLDFDELRPYVPGDDVRDIDWKATARSGAVLIKRFVSETHHKVLLVVDAGINMTALTPSGERKCDIATHILGAIGLITLGRSDEIGMVYGDARGSINVRLRRGENHVENMLARYHSHVAHQRGGSDIVCQLTYVADHYRHTMLIVVVSDEPDPTPELEEALQRLAGRHDLLWAMVADLSAAENGEGGFDVATGRPVLGSAAADPRVVAAYRRAEQQRAQRTTELLNRHAIAHTTISSSSGIRTNIAGLTRVGSRAG